MRKQSQLQERPKKISKTRLRFHKNVNRSDFCHVRIIGQFNLLNYFFFIKRSRLCHTCGFTIAHTLYNIKTQFSTKPYSISQHEYSNRRIWIHCEKTFSLIKLLNLYPISFKNGEKNKELIGYLFYDRDYNTTKSIFTCLAKIRTCWWRQTNRK